MWETLLWSLGALWLCAQVAGVAAGLHVLFTPRRTTAGTIAWAVVLLGFPAIAVPVYLLFGRSRLEAYAQSRRRTAERLAAEDAEKRDGDAPGLAPEAVLERLALQPFLEGNRIELIPDGTATFEAILEGIRAAKDYILVQFYIVRDDRIGNAVADALIERAQAGVRVCFLYDDLGCMTLSRRYKRKLRKGGVAFCAFGTANPWLNPFRLNFRSHRKLVLVDGRVAWMGGHNLGDEYLGRNPKYGPWRDTHGRVEGPVVWALQRAFLEDWVWSVREPLQLHWDRAAPVPGGFPTLVLPSGPADDLETFSLMLLQLINTAQERFWIESAYLAPDEQVLGALRLAALRGVDVRILMPDNPDKRSVWLAGYYFAAFVQGTGVRVFRYQRGFLHSKLIVVDDDLATLGTGNLDNRSQRINFEMTLVVRDRDYTARVAQLLLGDMEASREVAQGELEKKSLGFRFAVRVASLFAPVL